jgi:hypothetical protein
MARRALKSLTSESPMGVNDPGNFFSSGEIDQYSREPHESLTKIVKYRRW